MIQAAWSCSMNATKCAVIEQEQMHCNLSMHLAAHQQASQQRGCALLLAELCLLIATCICWTAHVCLMPAGFPNLNVRGLLQDEAYM